MKKITPSPFKNLILAFAMIYLANIASAQTVPAGQTLIYTQDFSSLGSSSTTYPTGMQGWKIGNASSSAFETTAPVADQSMIASSSANNNTGGVHNYNGKIGILASGSIDPAIELSIVTTNLSNIVVNFDVMTIRNPYDGTSNTRINNMELQYRVGSSTGAFVSTGSIYYNNTTTQTGSGVTTPQNLQTVSVNLPSDCNNQSTVQLRWVQRDLTGTGSRPSFAVDNITVTLVQGTTGTTGPTGPTGPAGATGATGAMGATGAQGIQGVTGPTGADGSSNGWSLTGNSGITTNNYLGTTDEIGFSINTHDSSRVFISNHGRVGIGTGSAPLNYKLQLHSTEMTNSGQPQGRLIQGNITSTSTGSQHCCTYYNDSIINFGYDSLSNGRLLNTGTLSTTELSEGTTTFQMTNFNTEEGFDKGLQMNITGLNASICLKEQGTLTMQSQNGIGVTTAHGNAALWAHDGYTNIQADNIYFRINPGYVAMYIDNNRNVGIGTTSPNNKLDIAGAAVIGASYAGTQTAPANGLLVQGKVGIGTTDPKDRFQIGDNYNSIAIADLPLYDEDLGWSTSYIGFNGVRDNSNTNNPWLFKSDQSHNGGGVIMNNLAGPMIFIPINSQTANVSSNQTIPDDVLYKLRVMQIDPATYTGTSISDFSITYYGGVEINGKITAREVEIKTPVWSDYVFDKNYDLLSISALEKYIKENKHLPDVPSANEVKEKGINVGDMDATLLKKIEELTLYVIDLKKQNDEILKENEQLKVRITKLEK